MKQTSISLLFLSLLALNACQNEASQTEVSEPSSDSVEKLADWTADLDVQNTSSSSELLLTWRAPEFEVDHYKAVFSDEMSERSFELESEPTEFTATALKADTDYDVLLTACADSDCEQSASSEAVSASTPEEAWQIQGEGHSYKTALQVVEGGQTLSYALVYGEDAPKKLAGTMKFYYNSKGVGSWEPGTRVAILDELDSATPLNAGLQQSCLSSKPGENVACSPGALNLYAVQPIPLKDYAVVRLFFEAADGLKIDAPNQLYYLDSQDGYEGEDFNPDPNSEICGGPNSDDLSIGGDCEPTLIIPAGPQANSGMLHVRQSKIGYPLLDTWTWDEAPGTFMIITGADQCEQTVDGLFYSTWDGKEWSVEKDEDGCAKPLVDHAHGPVIVHLGEGRYKVYYEAYTEAAGVNKEMGKSNKPLRVLYGDASLTGDPDVLEFEDWEDQSLAREVQFLWPDASELNEYQESGLGDHFIFLPTQDLSEQVMYMNLGGMDDDTPKEFSQGLGTATLTNP